MTSMWLNMDAEPSALNVLIITHYFPPEIGAPPARLFELAARTSTGPAGHRVTVVTGFPNYPTGVLAPGVRERLAARGVPRAKLSLITNGVDTNMYRPAPARAGLATRLGLDERKVFLYAGTHGLAQGLDVVLEAARRTTNPEVVY